MKNKFLFFFFLSLTLFAKDVLILHSYHKGYEWSDSISLAIEKNLKNDFKNNIHIYTEYMDTKHIYSYEYKEHILKLYQYKYKHKKFDLIIASDNNALNFLEKYNQDIFVDTPIVFCGINNFNKELFNHAHIKNRTTGVVESVDIEKNIQLILKLHKNTKKILVLNDTTTTGRAIKKEFYSIEEKYKNIINIEYIDSFKIKELKNKVSKLHKDTVILFMLLFKDKTGKIFTFKDGLQAISNNTKNPIYGLWDFYLPYGLVGGYLTNGYAQGYEASRLAKEILNGKDITKIPIVVKSPNRYIFDYNQLEKFKINKNILPNNSIIKNQPENFYIKYRYELTLLLIVFIITLTTMFILFMALMDKRKAKKELQIQLKFIETLLNTLSTPIFYKDKDGKYLGGNDAFCNFIGLPKEEILGKTMYDFFQDQNIFLEAHEQIENKLLNNEYVGDYTLDYTNTNGKIQTMLVNKSLYYDLDGEVQGVLTVLHDITTIVEAQNAKKHHESFLAQQSKLAEIGEMINAIAHQWNEPLVEMSAIVQDLELQFKTEKISNKDMETFVSDSMIQIQYMSKTLKDFRDFLKPSVQKSYFDIENVFDEVINIIERQIKYSYIDLNIVYIGNKHKIYGFKNEFMQVLITIINNAKDAIQKEKRVTKNIKGQIDITIDSRKEFTSISIKDNGCGIHKKYYDKVFDPYFSTKQKGNGIGLYMSRVLIEDKMNGKIYFMPKSNLTELMIELPKRGNNNENTTS